MFRADVLGMDGGKSLNADVRDHLSECAKHMVAKPATLKMRLSDKMRKYDNRRIPKVVENDVNCEWNGGLYSVHRAIDDDHPLVQQLGHHCVKDKAGDGTYNNTNLLYAGSFVVEYDLVSRNPEGRMYMYCDASVLEEVAKEKMAGTYKKLKKPETTGHAFMDKLTSTTFNGRKERMAEEGPHVSSGKLMKDLKMLMKLYESETAIAEKMSICPTLRPILHGGGGGGDGDDDDDDDKPMFKVAFITNMSLMGLKVVFFPTALVHGSVLVTRDVLRTKALLKNQVDLLAQFMPIIVKRVEDQLKNHIMCFKIDVGGSSNWNLPGHCKKDDTALPYHHARLIGEDLEITNSLMVTSLGVVPTVHASEWMYQHLGEFEKRSIYSEKLLGPMTSVCGDSEWRRRILFSDLGPEMPFRNKNLVVNSDICVSGMCYKFLADGGGILINKYTKLDDSSSNSSVVSGLNPYTTRKGEERNGGADAGDGDADTPIVPAEPPPPPPVPTNIHPSVSNAYDAIIDSNNSVSTLCGMVVGKSGFFLTDDGNTAPGLAMDFLLATKASASEKRKYVEALTDTAKMIICCISKCKVVKFDTVLPYALLQLVIRYECRRLRLPRDIKILQDRLKLRKWNQINFKEMWKFAHEEKLNPPTAEGLENAQEEEEEEDEEYDDAEQGTSGTAVNVTQLTPEEEAAKAEKERLEMERTTSSMETIKKLLAVTTSTFATGADVDDTMFAWMMVTLAERFCAFYNVVSNPEEYYSQMTTEEGMEIDGGLEPFKEMCSVMAKELKIYVPEYALERMVCRRGVEGYEVAAEREKNMTNNKITKVKIEEYKMVYSLFGSETKTFDYENNLVCPLDKFSLRPVFRALFRTVKEDKEKHDKRKEAREEAHATTASVVNDVLDNDDIIQENVNNSGHDEDGEAAVSSGTSPDDEFFEDVNDKKSFKFRSILCHRQKYVSPELVEELERNLSGLLTIDRVETAAKLEEMRKRNARMRSWVVPFTMPAGSVLAPPSGGDDESFASVAAATTTGCKCFDVNVSSAFSSNNNDGNGGSCYGPKKCVKLLVVPTSKHLRDLTAALRFNTMACERRYFSDVSTALGFVPVSSNPRKKNVSYAFSSGTPGHHHHYLHHSRWEALATEKAGGAFLKRVPRQGLYENVIKEDNRLAAIFMPRTIARKRTAEQHCTPGQFSAFFSGVWALCAHNDLETTVLGSTVMSPEETTSAFRVTEEERRLRVLRVKAGKEAVDYFYDTSDTTKPSFFECYEDMQECMRRTSMEMSYTVPEFTDPSFFERGGVKVNKFPAAKMWTVLETVRNCYRNSLPVDWESLVTDWTSTVLNLRTGVPNVDESGVVFELTKFLGTCARTFFGKDLDFSMNAEVWERLLHPDNTNWQGLLAKAYESAMTDNDVRSVENFINASSFLTNNDAINRLKIKTTDDIKLRFQYWTEDEFYPHHTTTLRSRAEWIAATENGIKNEMSFSMILAAVSMFRVMMLGEPVRALSNVRLGHGMTEGNLVPLVRCFKMTSKWCSCRAKADSREKAVSSIEESRFHDIENDPMHFYRFSAYVLGQIVNSDTVLEAIGHRILMSFDFNGFDTSNWLQFVSHHFSHVLMGRRSRLMSRPLAFIKNLVSLSSQSRNFVKKSDGGIFDEERVGKVATRMAKLILVKAADSVRVSANDMLDCCILEDQDVTAKNLDEFWSTVRQEQQATRIDSGFRLASNACTTSQLANINRAARVLNTNVTTHNIAEQLEGSIDNNEEELIDPSLDIRKDNGNSKSGQSNTHKNGTVPPPGNFSSYNVGGADDNSSSNTGFSQMCLENRNEEMHDDSVFSLDRFVAKRVQSMLPQNQINTNIDKTVKEIKNFLTVSVPFGKNEHKLYGVTRTTLEVGLEAIKRWNATVEQEAERVVEECQNSSSTGSVYDVNIVTCEDFAAAFGTGRSRQPPFVVGPSSFGGPPQKGGKAVVGPGAKIENESAVMYQNPDHHGAFWFNYATKKVENVKKNNWHGGRMCGRPLRDFLSFEGGITETRVVALEFMKNVVDSYWDYVLVKPGEGDGESGEVEDGEGEGGGVGNGSGGGGGKKKKNKNKLGLKKHSKFGMNLGRFRHGQRSGTVTDNNCDVLVDLYEVNSKMNVPMRHDPNLSSLYDDRDLTAGRRIPMDNMKVVNDNGDVFVVLGRGRDVLNTFKPLHRLWNCNNGISPKNQTHLVKKLLFKNMNELWIKLYERHISSLCNWGCITDNNLNSNNFTLVKDNPPVSVKDCHPPSSLFHSSFLDAKDYEKMLRDIVPIVKLHEKYTKKEGGEEEEKEDVTKSLDEPTLAAAVYGREVLSTCVDPAGGHCISWFTNSLSVLYTPGTTIDGRSMYDKSCYDPADPAYVDENLVGKEEEKMCRNYVSADLQIGYVLRSGVFLNKKFITPHNRTLRLIDYDKSSSANSGVSTFDESEGAHRNCKSDDDCFLLRDSIDAKRMLITMRAVMNKKKLEEITMGDQRSTMKYLAGFDKGFIIDPSMYAPSRFNKSKERGEIQIFKECADHVSSSHVDVGSLLKPRIFFTDWASISSMFYAGYSTDRPLTSDDVKMLPAVLSEYNKHPMLGKIVGDHPKSCSFMANPVCPAKIILKRSPNIRLCITNAGTALVSKIMAEAEKLNNDAGLIMDGTATPFRMSENTMTCISVDNNRFFLIDGSFLLGGRIEKTNLVTDLFTRCKLKSEKHVIINSLFSTNFVSAALATAIEGTSLGQGLGLLEHVSYMKNLEATNTPSMNFWSGVDEEEESDDEEDGGKGLGRCLPDGEEGAEDMEEEEEDESVSVATNGLVPPSVYTKDEDYIFLKMLYEISRVAPVIKGRSGNRSSGSTTSHTALHALRKCYTACVDQKTGTGRLHVIYILKGVMNFGGLCTAICSGDGEKAHHVIQTLSSIAMNIASKSVVVFVGTRGNNLKTSLVELCKTAWFERFTDINVTALNSSGDSMSSTQANVASFAGKKNIVIADEVGYQGSFNTTSGKKWNGNGSSIDNNNGSYDGTKVVHAGEEGGTRMVFDHINNTMTDSRLKVCDRECRDIMRARRGVETETASTATTTITTDCRKRKRAQLTAARESYSSPPSSSSLDDHPEWVRNSKDTVHIKAFASKIHWWNCNKGTLTHEINDAGTVYNMSNRGVYPFSVTRCTDSPWLKATDSIFNHCRKAVESRGKYTEAELKIAISCLLGDYGSRDVYNTQKFSPVLLDADDKVMTEWQECRKSIDRWKELNKPKNKITTSATVARSSLFSDLLTNGEGGEGIEDTRNAVSSGTTKFDRAENVFNQLVKSDDLLNWSVTRSRDDRSRPVLTCYPSNSGFADKVKEQLGDGRLLQVKTAAGVDRLACDNAGTAAVFKETLNSKKSGVLYAFHAIYSGKMEHGNAVFSCTGDDVLKKRQAKKLPSPAPEETVERGEEERAALGPTLVRVTPRTIAGIKTKSNKLSSILFGSEYMTVDEDVNVNMCEKYDNSMFDLIRNPWKYNYPRFTSDGANILQVWRDDCNSVLAHIKVMVDKGKININNSGTFIKLCVDNNLLDEFGEKSSLPSPALKLSASSLFLQPPLVSSSASSGDKPQYSINTDRKRRLYTALTRYKSNGLTTTVSEIANAVSSSTDVENAITKYMLPGQFNSNFIKKITTPNSSASIRTIYDKASQCSVTVTPIMMSNSYTFSFFVDEAMSKRLITFPCDTQFVFGSKNEDVKKFVRLMDEGLKCLHAGLILERRRGLGEKNLQRYENNLNRRIKIWNKCAFNGGNNGTSASSASYDCGYVATTLPAKVLQLLVKNKVLEIKDARAASDLNENTNTFFHLYTTFSLCAKTASIINNNNNNNISRKRKRQEGSNVFSKRTPTPIPMCQINPKSLNTMAMNIARSRQCAWSQLNSMLNCVIFVETPFIETTRLYGEDFNIKMHAPRSATLPALNVDWCVGLRVPNPDMDVLGYDSEGAMMGAGAALAKHVCDAWGSSDIRSVMFSCHHLHMLFELVLQFTEPKKKLKNMKSLKHDSMDYASVVLACLLYHKMMSGLDYPVFLEDYGSGSKEGSNKCRRGTAETIGVSADALSPSSPYTVKPKPTEIPMFLAMLVNKPLYALRNSTNLGQSLKPKAGHSTVIKYVVSNQLGLRLNPAFLCETCKRC